MKFDNKYKMKMQDNILFARRNLVDLIWKLARLEGINATYPEVYTICEGMGVAGISVRSINAIYNLKDAWDYILDNIESVIDMEYISNVNGLVGKNDVNILAGVIRTSNVGISGTNWKPAIPDLKATNERVLKIIKQEKTATEKGIELMLFLMRNQTFFDGNKRTAILIANHYFIKNGCGLLSIDIDKLNDFGEMLRNYYETNNDIEIKKFIYENFIDGLMLF